MKTIQRLTQKLLASVAAVAVLGLASQAMAQNGPTQLSARVILIKGGEARASSDGQTWHMLKVGEVLKPGAVIQTGEKATVDILLGNGNGSSRLTAVNYNPILAARTCITPRRMRPTWSAFLKAPSSPSTS